MQDSSSFCCCPGLSRGRASLQKSKKKMPGISSLAVSTVDITDDHKETHQGELLQNQNQKDHAYNSRLTETREFIPAVVTNKQNFNQERPSALGNLDDYTHEYNPKVQEQWRLLALTVAASLLTLEGTIEDKQKEEQGVILLGNKTKQNKKIASTQDIFFEDAGEKKSSKSKTGAEQKKWSNKGVEQDEQLPVLREAGKAVRPLGGMKRDEGIEDEYSTTRFDASAARRSQQE
ncbi:unnamed protein product, partial [Amoebophrya sp. A120]|eukprot:GSA120T00015722001.1